MRQQKPIINVLTTTNFSNLWWYFHFSICKNLRINIFHKYTQIKYLMLKLKPGKKDFYEGFLFSISKPASWLQMWEEFPRALWIGLHFTPKCLPENRNYIVPWRTEVMSLLPSKCDYSWIYCQYLFQAHNRRGLWMIIHYYYF